MSAAFVCVQMVTYGELHDKAAALARVLTQVRPAPQGGRACLEGT